MPPLRGGVVEEVEGGDGGDEREDDEEQKDDAVEEVVVEAAKRGRGRPKGSLNKKKRKESEAQESGKKKKSKGNIKGSYFSNFEDVLLCKAYHSVSEDPTVGTNQTKEKFWDRVHEKYSEIIVEEDLEGEYERNRAPVSCYNRLCRKIVPGVTKFNPYYKRVIEKNESGKTLEDKMMDALFNFQEDTGESFKFKHCLDVLWQMPKYDPCCEEGEDEDQDPTVGIDGDDTDGTGTTTDGAGAGTDSTRGSFNKIGHVQGGKMTRPTGKKRAKELMEKMELKRELAEKHGSNMKEMGRLIGEPANRLADAIDNASKLDRSQKVTDQRLAYVAQCMSMGMKEEAKEIMKLIHADMMATATEAATPQRTNLTPQSAQGVQGSIDDSD
jgi:hypothetical protein